VRNVSLRVSRGETTVTQTLSQPETSLGQDRKPSAQSRPHKIKKFRSHRKKLSVPINSPHSSEKKIQSLMHVLIQSKEKKRKSAERTGDEKAYDRAQEKKIW